MSRLQAVLAIVVAAVLLLAPDGAVGRPETICYPQRVRVVRSICGIVIDQVGVPIAHARLSLSKNGKEFVVLQADEDGKFSIDGLSAGSYDIRAEARGFVAFEFPIVLAKPRPQCKRALEVELLVGGEGCPRISLVRPKDVERRLHSSD
jgi:hypothetical protein